jgi:hypothetical protein
MVSINTTLSNLTLELTIHPRLCKPGEFSSEEKCLQCPEDYYTNMHD